MLRRVCALAAMGALLSSATGACGTAKDVVKSADDAGRYVDDVLRGKSPNEFSLADDATPVARAAVADAAPLSSFQQVVDEAPSAACDVAGLVSDAAELVPDSLAPVTLDLSEQLGIPIEAIRLGVSRDHSTRVVDAAMEMAQSTWFEAATKACEAAQSI